MVNNRYSRPVAALTNRKYNLQIFELPAKVGRNDKVVDVHIFHESISREHCLVEFINGRFTIRDLNSSAGTSVNGSALEPGIPYYIDDGDKVVLGKVKLRFTAYYDELKSRMNSLAAAPPQSQLPKADQFIRQDQYGKHEDSGMKRQQGMTEMPYSRGERRKTVTISARRLDMFEYDENEVVNVECGLRKTEKPLSYTQDLRKKELEVLPGESSYQDSAINTTDSEEDYIEGYTDAPAEIPAEEPAEEKEIEKMAVEPNQEIEKESEHESETLAEGDDLWDDTYDNEETMILTEEMPAPPVPAIQMSWVDEDSGEKGTLTVDKYPFNVGRKSGINDYLILKKSASRRHMHFAEKDGDFFICDDGSSNGVRLNGEKIEQDINVPIKEGDSIRIARVIFTIEKIS